MRDLIGIEAIDAKYLLPLRQSVFVGNLFILNCTKILIETYLYQ